MFSTLADGVPEVIKATREQLRLGADHIKIMLSGGVASPNDPLDSIQYREDEIAACVEEAQRWGSYVCAHAYSDVAIRRAVKGLSVDDARERLRDYGDATVDVWPGWVTSITTYDFRLDVRVVSDVATEPTTAEPSGSPLPAASPSAT